LMRVESYRSWIDKALSIKAMGATRHFITETPVDPFFQVHCLSRGKGASKGSVKGENFKGR